MTSKFSTIQEIKEALQHLENKFDFSHDYVIISRHLINDKFMKNENSRIRIETAICICKLISRIDLDSLYGEYIVEEILIFFLKQLQNLDKNSENYSQYCDLLKLINITKVFTSITFSSEKRKNDIHEKLFSLAFDLVEKNPEVDLKSELFPILKLILEQSKSLSFAFLYKFFQNLTNPMKIRRKESYKFTINLIENMRNSFEAFFVNFIEFLKKEDPEIQNCNIFEIAYELRSIFPEIVENLIFPNAIEKMNSNVEETREISADFVGRMFSVPELSLVIIHSKYLSNFLQKLGDKSETVRFVASKHLKRIFLNFPASRKKITKNLKKMKHCSHLEMRNLAISLLTNIIFQNIEILQENEFFSNFIENVIPDQEFSVRERELISISLIFKKYVKNIQNLSPEIRKILLSIQSKLLYNFRHNKNLLDTIMIETLFRECLVSFELPVESRMKRLFHFYSTLHLWVVESFEDLQMGEKKNRELLKKWVNLVEFPELREEIIKDFRKMLFQKESIMDSMSFVESFESYLKQEPRLVNEMEKIVDSNVSCEEAIEAFNNAKIILNRSNPKFHVEFLKIIERGTSFIFDHESIRILIDYVFDVLGNGSIAEELDLDPVNAGERGIKLLQILSSCFPETFQFEDIVERFVMHLNMKSRVRKSFMISLLGNIGKQKLLEEIIESESTLETLISICQHLAIEGSPEESKASIQCLKFTIKNVDLVFEEILENIESNSTLIQSSSFFLGSVVALGCIATERSSGRCDYVEHLIQKVFNFLQIHDSSENVRTEEQVWCREDELSVKERCYEESIKCVGLWIYGLKINSQDLIALAEDFFNLVNRHLFEPFTETEPTRNRLRAITACTILKVCQIPEFRRCLPPKNLYRLSQLINDECSEVSEYFVTNLIMILKNGSAPRFLSNEFLAFFIILRGKTKFVEEVYEAFESIVEKRNLCVKYILERTESNAPQQQEFCEGLVEWIPEFSIIYGLLIFAHDPDFKDFEDLTVAELKILKRRLWKFLQPLVENSCFNCSHIFQTIGEQLNHFGDADSPDFNQKLWTLNEILLSINKGIKFKKAKIFNGEIKIPGSHFVELGPEEANEKISYAAVGQKLLRKK